MLLAVATLAQAQNDLRLGTWALNVAKSKYTPGPAPASETRTYKTQGAALQVSIESIDTRGNRASLRYTAGDDGRDSPMTGLAFANAVNMKRLDSNTFQIDTKKDGKVIGTTKGEISKDGKTLTLTSKMTNPTGGAITNIAVYDKR
jgi:hypothetical protein